MALANIVAAFGLAGAAGLNAYIPLLIVAVLARLGLLQLSAPFDALASWPAIIALVVLGAIEFIADKMPGVDHINDAIQTFVRPAAGAILFAANTGVVSGLDTTLALICGLVLAFGVHATKAAARPVVNGATMGIGAPFVSLAEDVLAAIGSLLAVFFPLLFVLFAAALCYLAYRLIRQARRLRAPRASQAPSSPAAP
jgi:predicted tellurium resistance membrane protein TerC